MDKLQLVNNNSEAKNSCSGAFFEGMRNVTFSSFLNSIPVELNDDLFVNMSHYLIRNSMESFENKN